MTAANLFLLIWNHGKPPRPGCQGVQGSSNDEHIPVPCQGSNLGRGSLCKASSAPQSPRPSPRCPPSHTVPTHQSTQSLTPPCRVWLPPAGDPQFHSPATHGFRVPQPSTTSGCFSKGIFWSRLAWSPPCFLLPRPGRRHQLVVPRCPREAPGAHAGVAWALGRAVGAATRWPWPSGRRPGVSGGVRGTDARPAESPPPGTLPTASGQIRHRRRGRRAGQVGHPRAALPAPRPGLCWRGGEGSRRRRKTGAAGGRQAIDSSQ